MLNDKHLYRVLSSTSSETESKCFHNNKECSWRWHMYRPDAEMRAHDQFRLKICRPGQNTWNLLPCCMIYSFISIYYHNFIWNFKNFQFYLHVKFVAYQLKVLYHDHAWTSWWTASLCTYYVSNLYSQSLYQLSTLNSNYTLAVTERQENLCKITIFFTSQSTKIF